MCEVGGGGAPALQATCGGERGYTVDVRSQRYIYIYIYIERESERAAYVWGWGGRGKVVVRSWKLKSVGRRPRGYKVDVSS